MPERVETVRLVAEVSNYVAGMEQARQSTSKMSDEAQRKLADQTRAFGEVGRAALAIGAVAAAGVALAVARFAEFDQAMSNVKAVTQESTANMGLLTEAALEFGASSVFTATEAANAIEELGKAGITTADILGGALEGSLNLASAGELGIARAAEIASTTLSQFGLAGSEAARVADVLAAGAGKALGSVDDLANGLKFVGPIAASMGVSLEETTGVLAMFAQQGIIGEQAGTSLRGMLSSLTSPSKEARKEIEALGVKLYDGQGKFLGLENAAGQMSKAYVNMTDEQKDASLGMLFGNQQVTAARILYNEGADGVREWTDAVDDSGYAAQVARARLDNLKGDVEALGGSLDTFLIKSGSGANDVLRSLVQSLTFLTDIAGEMPQPVLDAGIAIGTVVAAVGLVGGAALIGIPKVVAFKGALDVLGISAGGAALKVGLIGGAIAAATIALSVMVNMAAEAKAKVDAYAGTLESGTNRITKATRDMVKENLAAKKAFWFMESDSAFDAAAKVGIGLDLVTDAAMGNVDALEKLAKITQRGNGDVKELGRLADEAGLSLSDYSLAVESVEHSVKGESSSIEEAIRVAKQKQSVDKATVSITGNTADAYKEAAKEVENLNSELMELIATINKANGINQDAITANASYQKALADAKEEVKEFIRVHGKSVTALDESTAAGSQNAAMLADLAAESQAAAEASLEAGGSAIGYTDALAAGRQEIYDTALALTGNADAAQALTDKIYAMPDQKEIDILMETWSAQAVIERFILANDGRRIRIGVDTLIRPGQVGMFAGGGTVGGVGTSKSDSNLALLSRGEEVTQEPYASRFRPQLKLMNQGIVPRFAFGGTNAPAYAPAPIPQYMNASSVGGKSSGPVVIAQESLDGLAQIIVPLLRTQSRMGVA